MTKCILFTISDMNLRINYPFLFLEKLGTLNCLSHFTRNNRSDIIYRLIIGRIYEKSISFFLWQKIINGPSDGKAERSVL